MCLILFAYKTHPSYPLIVLANRDEFYQRPTAQADWWENRPGILAGKDLKAGGTWMGTHKNGRFAALTNYRDPHNILPHAPSRGDLVLDFLDGKPTAREYMNTLASTSKVYNGYNLLVDDGTELFHYSNEGTAPISLSPGVYGLSNALLDSPWPKVELGKSSLAALIQEETLDIEKSFAALGNSRSAPDSTLPQTGVSLEWERLLSPMYIASETYGTRCSTVFTRDVEGNITFEERTFIPKAGVKQFRF